MEFLWQWAHGFAEVVVVVDFDGELAAVGDEDDAGDADDVADVGFFEEPVFFFADDVLTAVDLDVAANIGDVGEACFALGRVLP